MEEIVKRLTENRQVELAKRLLESTGYRVRKLRESSFSNDDVLADNEEPYDKEAAGGSFSEILNTYKMSGMLLREIIDIEEENGDYDESSPLAQIASKLGGTIDDIYMFTPEDGGDSERAYSFIIDSAERSGTEELYSFKNTSVYEPWILCTSEITGDYVVHAAYGYYEVYIRIK